MAATTRDVARHLGISSATVSRAFTNPEKLNPETLEKVKAAAKELHYRPNALSSIFRAKSTNTILAMVPDLSNAFYGPVLAGLERAAFDQGFALLLSDTRDDPKIEKECASWLETRRVDGIIQLGSSSAEDLFETDDLGSLPFVHAIEAPLETGVPTISIDNVAASKEMAEYLLSLGHRQVGFIGGPVNSGITRDRERGLREALEETGISPEGLAGEYSDFSLSGGETAGIKLLQRHPQLTAVFCMSDEIAIGAMKSAKSLGLSLPHDLSIVGFDNIEFGSFCDPGLTTVMQPAEKLGEISMNILLSRLANPGHEQTRITLPTELIIRGSARRI